PRESVADVAIIIDQDSLLTVQEKITNDVISRFFIHEVGRMGTVPAVFEMDDLPTAIDNGYKMYIFPNAFYLNDTERALINSLKADGNVLVFMFAPGVMNPDAEQILSIGHVRSLVEMNLVYQPRMMALDLKPLEKAYEYAVSLSSGLSLGRYYRAITTGLWIPPGGTVAPTYVGGYLSVSDPCAKPLAEYVWGPGVGFAVKEHANWTSVFYGACALPAPVMRDMAKNAGCHIYIDTDDFIWRNASFLGLYTVTAGEKTVRLPEPFDVYDVFDDRLIGEGIDKFVFTAGENKTYLFFTGDVSVLEATKKMIGMR
ncbi:MAG: hypothetical protein PHH90_11280, partial [Limnochordia bacterium]|nr:hypothetical protein [Limnochordia bacterium]